jgi:CheY-like chemotaxis protein
MPDMSGWEVAAALREAHPELPVGLVTGWGEQVDSEQTALYQLEFVLAKPFLMEEVLAVVSAALAA